MTASTAKSEGSPAAEPIKKPSAIKRAIHLGGEALWLRPQYKMKKVVPEASSGEQAETLLKAASHHLTRIGALADTEWKVTLAFWAALLASSATMIGAAAKDRPSPLPMLVWENRAVALAAMLIGAAIFVYGFSVNQSRSITTERNRFLHYQNAALHAVEARGSQFLIPIRVEDENTPLATVSASLTRRSVVWTMKLLSTSTFIGGAWITAMTVSSPLDGRLANAAAWTSGAGRACIVMAVAWLIPALLFTLRARRAER